MAKKFKDYYDLECARLIAGKIGTVWSGFSADDFLQKLAGELPGKEFLARQDTFAAAFEAFMTGDYRQDIAIFSKILGTELQTTEGMFIYGRSGGMSRETGPKISAYPWILSLNSPKGSQENSL